MQPSRTFGRAGSLIAVLSIFVVAPASCLVAALPVAAAPSTCPATTAANSGQFCADPQGWIWTYDATTASFKRVASSSTVAGGGSANGTLVRYSYSPACTAGATGDGQLCGRALEACATDDPGAILYTYWVQQLQPVELDRVYLGTFCLGGAADTVTLAQLGIDLDEQVRDHLPALSASAQPNPVAIVNLPVIVSAPQQPAPNFAVANPLPGAVTVTSTYRWVFDDGAALVGPGRPYDGTDPRTAPQDYYLAHTYGHADAAASVTLTVSWHATFTLAGGPAVALPDIVTPPQTVDFQVHEVRSVLVAS